MLSTHHHTFNCRAQKVRWLPFLPGTSLGDGFSVVDKLLATAGWSPTTEGPAVTIGCLRSAAKVHGSGYTMDTDADPSQHKDLLVPLGQYTPHSNVADMASVPMYGHVLMVVGGEDGALGLVRVAMPAASGAREGDLQVECVGEAVAPGAVLKPWTPPLHQGAARACDVWADTSHVASAGDDGRLVVLDAHQSDAPVLSEICAPSQASLRAARWTAAFSIATAGTGCGVQLWDCRRPGREALRMEWEAAPNHEAAAACHGVQCLDFCPSRPHICAAGSSNGSLTWWDMRLPEVPLHAAQTPKLAGLVSGSTEINPVWEVRFERAELSSNSKMVAKSGGLPLVLAGMENGCLSLMGADGSGINLIQEYSAINSFDLDASSGQEIICCTENEGLLQLKR